MDRFKQRREDYKKALLKLEEAMKEEPSEIVIDGILHRFEFTFELAWKTIKDYLEYMGNTEKTGSPRENIQMAYNQKIIDSGELWIEMMLARNSLSHLYDEETSRQIYINIKEKYMNAFEELNKKFDEIL